ncbi:MAG: hypothetical protein EOO88_56710, partial [Pedobacter sp.]
MKELSKENIKLAQDVAKAIGIEPNVYPFYDNDRSHELDILNLVDPIDKNVSIHCTIGLSDYENLVGGKNIPVELLMTGYKKFDKVKNILSTCGFYIIKDKFECRPGSVFMRMIEFYYKDKDMPQSPTFEPIPENGLGLIPTLTAQSMAGLVKVDVATCKPGEDPSLNEDGPLFRATMRSLEQKTSNMRTRMKKVLKTAEAAESAQQACNQAVADFTNALRD